jgi:hypothetical protein
MSDTNKNSDDSLYGQQERKLSGQSEAFLNMLTRRGLLEDPQIQDDKARQAAKAKKRNMYHNTQLMLKHYRDITWALECFPADIATELDHPLGDLDALISLINTELCMDNAKLEGRLMSVQKSRLLLDRVNDALTILKQKPGNGEVMYNALYLTYIVPEKLKQAEILFRLNISPRHYYRVRQQAINILSIRLWAAPAGELDAWLEVLTLLEAL